MMASQSQRQLIDEFIAEQSIAKISRKNYAGIIFQFFVFCAITGADWKYLTKATVNAYRDRMIKEKKSANTINLYLTVVKKFFSWCHDKRYYSEDITRGIRGIKKELGFRKKPLTDDQVRRLFACIDRSTLIGKRDAALLSLMIKSGIRGCEVIRGTVDDIRYNAFNEPAFNVLGKGRYEKTLQIMTPRTFDYIKDYLNARGCSTTCQSLFMSHQNGRSGPLTVYGLAWIICNRLIEAGIKDPMITPHSFRHTYACTMVRDKVDPLEIQKHMRHANYQTTMVYLDYIAEELKDHSKIGKMIDDRY